MNLLKIIINSIRRPYRIPQRTYTFSEKMRALPIMLFSTKKIKKG